MDIANHALGFCEKACLACMDGWNRAWLEGRLLVRRKNREGSGAGTLLVVIVVVLSRNKLMR